MPMEAIVNGGDVRAGALWVLPSRRTLVPRAPAGWEFHRMEAHPPEASRA